MDVWERRERGKKSQRGKEGRREWNWGGGQEPLATREDSIWLYLAWAGLNNQSSLYMWFDVFFSVQMMSDVASCCGAEFTEHVFVPRFVRACTDMLFQVRKVNGRTHRFFCSDLEPVIQGCQFYGGKSGNPGWVGEFKDSQRWKVGEKPESPQQVGVFVLLEKQCHCRCRCHWKVLEMSVNFFSHLNLWLPSIMQCVCNAWHGMFEL